MSREGKGGKEMKICECGCGRETKLASESNHRTGSIKGNPLKFLHGHNKANWKGGESLSGTKQQYIIKLDRKHPRQHNGYVLKHRLIAEKVLGKFLPENAVVHHRNGDTFDNKNDNLIICENDSYHKILHSREKAFRECGHSDWRQCLFCHKYDDVKNLKHSKGGGHYHLICQTDYQREYREEKRQCVSA